MRETKAIDIEACAYNIRSAQSGIFVMVGRLMMGKSCNEGVVSV